MKQPYHKPIPSFSRDRLVGKATGPVWVTRLLVLILALLPSSFNPTTWAGSERVLARVVSVDNTAMKSSGLIHHGEQTCGLEIRQRQFKGRVANGVNLLQGSLEMDKVFVPGDRVFAVIDFADTVIRHIQIVDHYRLDLELLLAILFFMLLVVFARGIGLRAMLSFLLTILMLWKVLLPAMLHGLSPIPVALGVTLVITALIILLVYGPDRRAAAAILGSIGGTVVTCVLALVFVRAFRIHGAVMSHAESLLYSGFQHLDLTGIFTASIFVASSGALMDVAVDITSAVHEVMEKNPTLSRLEAIRSGMNVGRTVVGTMATTLLLAYSGGYMALLMVFMAQGTPLPNMLNLKYVASELLHTLLGSFGLITVAPLTALSSGWLLGNDDPTGSKSSIRA